MKFWVDPIYYDLGGSASPLAAYSYAMNFFSLALTENLSSIVSKTADSLTKKFSPVVS